MSRRQMVFSEQMLSDAPVVVRRRVKWGECDPAGVVYTPVFAEYAVSAFQYFMEAVLGSPLQSKLRELDLGTPLRALSFDFVHSLYPDQIFDMTVYVREVRNTTFETEIFFSTETGETITRIVLVAICVHHAERKSKRIPDSVRAAFENYMGRFPSSGIKTSH